MKPLLTLTLLVVGLLVASAPVMAQQRDNAQSQRRLFDPSTVETMSGVITRIDSVPSPRGPSAGLHIQLQTAEATLPVHLGPAWFFADRSMTLAVGDSLMVRGSQVTWREAPALIAAEVHHESQMLRLRNETGRPVWRRQRPRR